VNLLESIEILKGGQALSLQINDGRTLRYHAIWLRDNALDEKTRAPGNGQRLITLADLPENLLIREADIKNNDLLVHFAPESHSAKFPIQWLLDNAYDQPETKHRRAHPLRMSTQIQWLK